MSQTKPRLVALGDLLLDVVVTPTRPIEHGTDVPGTLAFRRGGSAANTSAAFVRAGGRASLITCLGDDFWARPTVVRRCAPTACTYMRFGKPATAGDWPPSSRDAANDRS